MRSKQAPHRSVKPDPKFGRVDIAKLINRIMRNGKKTVAQKIVYNAFKHVSNVTKQDPIDIFEKAMQNLTPNIEVKGRRVGGANYQVPVIVMGERKNILAHRWLLDAARSRKGKPMFLKLADELLAASKGEGDAMKKRDDVQRMAEANRAFAHFA
ncbi:MAG: 30S ribosomal protein S7 [Candidatus Komeilibacteria bacterium RIFCSPLOWO2_01_FULL_52_15]|uniref:Small ribosomal subunit protein uS7 n=2 Tax=Candidatus Komeiliibacteriota TaxID=1817908 RepID=A0A1G2BPD9_9BACT|nr:MAG: 30S ribosomal protein S7 [Candidatus Komeilibacteria bacterium RIFCSPHIGHO2_01_FULL_52_14]OGY91025.1 MAG: 30S ribosomal protein S7 [Candidatus Komeilibacteria bacterium RIFCSPLOWO2_01_FULL_52_15]